MKKAKKENGKSRSMKHSKAFLDDQRARQDRFLKALEQTKCRVMAACDLSGVSVHAVLDWREDSKSDFGKRYQRVMSTLPVIAQDEALRRGVEGYEGRPMIVDVWDKKLKRIKKTLLPIREYSDVMLSHLLRATDKRFRPGELKIGEEDDKITVEIRRYA